MRDRRVSQLPRIHPDAHAGASPVRFPEHVPLPLGMHVLDDGSHSFPRFLGKVREVIIRPEMAIQTPKGSSEDSGPRPGPSKEKKYLFRGRKSLIQGMSVSIMLTGVALTFWVHLEHMQKPREWYIEPL